MVVNLYNNIRKKHKIHRLVAEAFIPNPNNLPQINHKNKIKTDNNVENLEWCTNKYNSRYSKSKEIEQYDTNYKYIRNWDSLTDVKEQLNINQSSISECCRGKRKTAGGYVWKFKDAE